MSIYTNVHLQRQDILEAFTRRTEEFYGAFTQLKRVGDQLVGPCPLHGGHGPNFKVDPDSGAWYCHSQCHKGGDVFTFLQLAKGLHYGDALKYLGDFVGIGEYVAPPRPRPDPPGSNPTPPELEAGGRNPPVYDPPLPPAVRLPDPDNVPRLHDKLMASPERLEWLRVHRGLTRETLVKFQVGMTYAVPGDIDAEIGHPRITFPVYDRAGVLINIREHLFAWEPKLDRQKFGKTLPWGPGLPAGLFGLQAVWGRPPLKNPSLTGEGGEPQASREGSSGRDSSPLTDHVLLVEGEPDALLANQLGFPAVSGTGGAGGWSPQNTRDLAAAKRVTILYDADEAGRKGAKARARDLSSTVPDVRIAELPPGLGKDLTEWVVEGGGTAEQLAHVISAAVPHRHPAPLGFPNPTPQNWGGGASPSARKPIPARVVDLADVPPPPAELPYLWGPYLNEGASHWLTGKTGLGKSTFAFNLACALAEGRTLWGVPCRARKLLYVDMESGDLGRSLKIQRLFKERESDRPGLRGQLLFVREPLRLPDESADLLAFCSEHRFDLVIFDTARRVFSVKDENDNAEVYNRIVPTLDALKTQGIATLTMGHPPKNGGLGARGAGAQEDAGDINLLLTMYTGEVNDPAGVISLSITKNRLLGLGQPPLYLRRVGGDQFENVDASSLPPPDAKEDKVSPRDRCREAITEMIGKNHGNPVSYKDLKNGVEAQGHALSTFHRAVKELMDEGEVKQPSSGRYVLYDPFAD